MYTEKMKKSLRAHGMTRRQYEFIADVLRKMNGFEVKKGVQHRLICEKFAERLAEQPGFDRLRFLRACGT